VAKFIVGWGSHLYYWVYPGVMVAVTGVFCGYIVGFLWPNFMSGSNPGPVFMALVAVVFSFFVAWIAAKGAGASTAVNLAINVIQISALVVFSVLASAIAPAILQDRRASSTTRRRWPPTPTSSQTAKDGSTCATPAAIRCRCWTRPASRFPYVITYPETDATGNFLTHPRALRSLRRTRSVTCSFRPRSPFSSWSAFESVTSMGGEAKNPTKHIPIAVIASLLIQGLFCYLIEYFAANYFLNSGYTMTSAVRLRGAHRRHDDHCRRRAARPGTWQVLHAGEAFTVFLALIGTTLSCMNTGARVTYAMGKDDEAPEHFGMLHAESLSPRRAIWTLACHLGRHRRHRRLAGLRRRRRAHRRNHRRSAARHLLQRRLLCPHDRLAALPNSLLTITLTSNFGTFILYALSCFLCIVAFHKRPDYSLLKHCSFPVSDYRQPGLHGLLR
jgi:APA family basic amino acid/polyamine antiporter